MKEIKTTAKRQPVLEERTFLAILRAADRLGRRAADMFKQHHMTPTQYNALRILRGGGPAGLACSQIASRMINQDPDITRLLDRLKRRGLITRRRGQKDRRVSTTFITPAGLELLKAMDEPVEQFHIRLLGHMKQKRLYSLIQFLEEIEVSLQ